MKPPPLMGTTRLGASLIEIMVVISVGAATLSLVGMLFHRMFQAEQNSARATLMELSTVRLADQFRRDIHAAQSVTRAPEAADSLPTLELVLPQSGSRIVYTGGPDKVHREITDSEGAAARETFRLPHCRVTFPVTKSERIATMLIERPHATLSASAQASRPLSPLPLEAELGRDVRIATGEAPKIATKSSEDSK